MKPPCLRYLIIKEQAQKSINKKRNEKQHGAWRFAERFLNRQFVSQQVPPALYGEHITLLIN